MKSLSLSEVSKYSKGKVDESAKKIIIEEVCLYACVCVCLCFIDSMSFIRVLICMKRNEINECQNRK